MGFRRPAIAGNRLDSLVVILTRHPLPVAGVDAQTASVSSPAGAL